MAMERAWREVSEGRLQDWGASACCLDAEECILQEQMRFAVRFVLLSGAAVLDVCLCEEMGVVVS